MNSNFCKQKYVVFSLAHVVEISTNILNLLSVGVLGMILCQMCWACWRCVQHVVGFVVHRCVDGNVIVGGNVTHVSGGGKVSHISGGGNAK